MFIVDDNEIFGTNVWHRHQTPPPLSVLKYHEAADMFSQQQTLERK